jgi:rod shape-determining protein MreC
MPAFEPDTDERRGRRGLLVPLGLLALAVLAIYLPPTAQEQIASALRSSILAPFLAVQSSLHETRILSESLEDLQTQLDSALAAVHSQTTLEEENERLRALLDLRDRGGPGFVAASALRSGTLGSESVFMLDVGSVDGVQVDDPVVVADGLVGMVRSVSPRTSVAMDWTYPDFRASAMTIDGVVFGIVEPRPGAFREEDRLVFNGVPYHTPVETGIEVVTSGMGSVYPRGIPLGVVDGLAETEAGWRRSYWLEPAVRPGSATHVLVWTRRGDAGAESLARLWDRQSPDSLGYGEPEGAAPAGSEDGARRTEGLVPGLRP